VKRGEALEVDDQAAGCPGGQFETQIEKKIAEVEMALLHLQQNIEIPERLYLYILVCLTIILLNCLCLLNYYLCLFLVLEK